MESAASKPTGAETVAWDLSDLYADRDDPALEADLDEADARAASFRQRYYGHIAALDADGMLAMLREYEAIAELSSKVGAYAHLAWSAETTDAALGALLQKATERDSRLTQELVFVELEWALVPDDAAERLIGAPELAHYRHFLEKARRYRPHLLTEPEERILAEKAVTGRSAWTRYFEETISAARYDLDGDQVALTRVLTRLYSPEREQRRQAAASVTTGLRELARTTTFVFNNLLADKASDDRLRHYETWISARNLGNEVEDATVEALVAAVTSRYDVVSRYYGLKRRLLGLDELRDYDRYAPLPAADRHYTWDEAKEAVLAAYSSFHPRMAEIAACFYDGRWIDAAIRPGKRGGAFSAGVVPSVHPYILVNYEGKSRDVMTVAHELGHGVHQYLSRGQGMLQMHTPLTTAETASVFGEMLVFQEMTGRESDPAVVLAMLTAKIEDSFATVFRQVSMNRFEHAVHTARREQGELTTERFCELWLETQRAMFQGSVTMTDDYGLWWSYVHHFTSVPGYVYAYAFGELLVLALYARYRQVGAGFADSYLEMLSAGGSDWPREIVRPLGVDLEEPGFWDGGLAILDDMVRQAEVLAGV